MLFSKSGVISGGSSDLRSKARCWDEKAVVQLKERKEQLTAELHVSYLGYFIWYFYLVSLLLFGLQQDLMRLKRKESDLKQIIAQAQGAKTRLKYAKLDLDNIRKKDLIQCQWVGLSSSCRLI